MLAQHQCPLTVNLKHTILILSNAMCIYSLPFEKNKSTYYWLRNFNFCNTAPHKIKLLPVHGSPTRSSSRTRYEKNTLYSKHVA